MVEIINIELLRGQESRVIDLLNDEITRLEDDIESLEDEMVNLDHDIEEPLEDKRFQLKEIKNDLRDLRDLRDLQDILSRFGWR